MLARKMHQIAPLEPRAGLATPPALAPLVMGLLDPDPRLRPRFAASLRRSILEIAAHVGDLGAPVAPRRGAPVRQSSVRATTISATSGLPPPTSTSARSLPFSLPCAGPAPELALHRLRPLPMFGRSAQSSRLLSLASEALHGVRGLVVAGRAGEGKTRLLRQGFAEVERTGKMIGAAASFDETITNAEVGLRACMRRLLGSPVQTLSETLASRWRWLASVPQPDVEFERIHEWLSPGARACDAETSARIAAMCVLAASRIYPVYLWLDDVAWSRDGAMELMVRLLETHQARALVVATLRSGTAEHPTVRAWLLQTAKAGAEFEMLPPLSLEDRVALLAAAGPLAADLARALGEMLDEPTLILVETVRACIEEGLLVSSEVGYVLEEGATLDDLVARARGPVLARRITTLLDAFGPDAPNAERVLCHAALLGLRFEERALRACLSMEGYAPESLRDARVSGSWVDRVLDRALLSGLLRIDGRGAYRFEHRMFLDVIVERCTRRSDGVDIFRTTADALVQTYGRYNADHGLAVAALYRAGGARDEAMMLAAVTTRAQCRGALFDAAARAIALMASWVDSDDLPPVHLHRALVERARGVRDYFMLDYPAARKHLHAAREMLEALGATDELHAVLYDISSTHFYQDHFAEAERYVQYAHDPHVDPWALARAHHQLSELCGLRLDLAGAVAHSRAAVEADRTQSDGHYRAVGLGTLAELLVASGALEDAAIETRKMSAIAGSVGTRQLRTDADRTEAALDVARGYFATARARLAPRVAQLIERGDAWHLTADLSLVALCTAALYENPGDVDRAVCAFKDAYLKVPHDEPCTWWAVRCTEAYLRANGREKLAAELGDVLDVRLQQIAGAFDDDEPITEDAEIRSDAATPASTQ